MRWWAVLGLVWVVGAPLVAVAVGTWFARRRRHDSVAVEDATRMPANWALEEPVEADAGPGDGDGPVGRDFGAASGRDVLPLL